VICFKSPITYLQSGQEDGGGDENTEALIEGDGTSWDPVTGSIPYFCITYSTEPPSSGGTFLPPPPAMVRL